MPSRSSSPAKTTKQKTSRPLTEPEWEHYADNVVARRVPACDSIISACERYILDRKRAESEGFPYHFDRTSALRAVQFFGFLRHSKGEWAGQPLALQPWQQFIVANLYGWKRVDGSRRFRTAYIAVPRKNGKSTTMAGLGLYMLVADKEPGAEVYSAATTKDQARIIFDEAVRMRTASPSLSRRVAKYRNSLFMEASNSRFTPLSSDENTLDGLNIHCGLVDELHAHASRELWDKLATARGARRQPLMISITTAGSDRHSFCFRQHEYSMKILDRVLDDEAFFAFIAQLNPGANWEDEQEWAKANPNLGISVKAELLREEAAKAKNSPTDLNAFLRYYLNVWTSSETRAILPHVWQACSGISNPNADPQQIRQQWLEELSGQECFVGLDLATTTDIAAEVLYFRDGRLLPFFFVPKENIERRAKIDRVPYDLWVKQGFIIPTPGNVIDYAFIRQLVNQHKFKYQIIEIGFDPYNATQLVNELQEDGLKMVEIRQGYLSMSAPTKEFLRLVMSAEIAHGNNPVLSWMADNLMLSQDPAGNIKPDKEKSREKIDGLVGSVMAIGRRTANPESDGSGVSVFGNCRLCGLLSEGKMDQEKLIFDCGKHTN